MRVLIFHGYLLGGTGSNVYNACLTRALVELGHEVHLLSQERHPERYPFIEAMGDWEGGELRVRRVGEGPVREAGEGPVRCTAYRPDIRGLLPVYVHDRYEGIEARTFSDCSDEEIDGYIGANVAAVGDVIALARPQIALANHLVMGPVILARALEGWVPYVVKVHGSALEYTVKPEKHRFLGFAREGLTGAAGVLVGSTHTARSLWQALEDRTLAAKTRLGPPGVDVHEFRPRARPEADAGLKALTQRLAERPLSAGGRDDAFTRDEHLAAAALAKLDLERDRIVVYVGKLIANKGLDLLAAAWPLVLAQVPDARLVVVGFGALREPLEGFLGDLAAGEIDAIRDFASSGRALEGGAGSFTHLLAFLDALAGQGAGSELESYLRAATLLSERVLFTGRLDHEELVDLLPVCEALIVPSTFPEAFGMVSVEGAACGAFPVSAAHSGLLEVSDILRDAVPRQAAHWLSFPIDDDAVSALSQRVIGWLGAAPILRAQTREALVRTVRERWSWESVAEGVIAAAQGELERLGRP